MKLIKHFDNFLKDTVNLNENRVKLLENSIAALKNAINASTWQPKIIKYVAQGSWAHKTIIKPIEGAAFDADLIVFIKPVEGWSAKQYIDTLYDSLKSNETYKDKVRRYSHCVTIEYAGERKIDIAPCVQDRESTETLEVCNRTTDEFEASKPEEYTHWLIDKNAITGSNNLRKTTRLIKYLRDIKTTFTCPSFLLTTLLGKFVYDGEEGQAIFSDVPTTLKTLMGRLDDWLQANLQKPTVRNPVLYDEIQSDAWNDEKYSNFRSQINRYRQWIDEAYDEKDEKKSIEKWQRVFGEDFAAGANKSASASKSIAESSANERPVIGTDLVTAVEKKGIAAIPLDFNFQAHMQTPKWPLSQGQGMNVHIRAQLHNARNGKFLCSAQSLQKLRPDLWIKFNACDSRGVAFPEHYEVMWRITNTGEVASKYQALRGDFYNSDNAHSRWETLSYRGVHMAEAFLIRKSDKVQFGRSQPYYVVIE